MKKGESKIAFTNDIIKQAAKELGIEETKVKSVYNEMVSYLRYLTTETDATAIFLPHLGTFYIKVARIFNRFDLFKGKEKYKNQLAVYKAKKIKIDSHIKEISDYNQKERKRKSTRHLEKDLINQLMFTTGKNMKEIEEFQNTKYEKN